MWAFLHATPGIAGEVTKWVDESGVTHFGNPQFAPAGAGEAVTLRPANGMDVPDMAILKQRNTPTAMKATVLERTKKKNPRGWRGHDGRPNRGGRPTHSRGRRAN